jgi:hypothetical protein
MNHCQMFLVVKWLQRTERRMKTKESVKVDERLLIFYAWLR